MVENSKLERVRIIKECAPKFANEKYILRWQLSKIYNKRILYLLLEKEEDLNSWLYIYNQYKQVNFNASTCQMTRMHVMRARSCTTPESETTSE